MKRDIVLISKIRTSEDITCSMKNCFAVIVQSGGRSEKSSGRRQTMKEKVNVTGVPETMVQTLYARAKETRKKNAKINDEIAVETCEKA